MKELINNHLLLVYQGFFYTCVWVVFCSICKFCDELIAIFFVYNINLHFVFIKVYMCQGFGATGNFN